MNDQYKLFYLVYEVCVFEKNTTNKNQLSHHSHYGFTPGLDVVDAQRRISERHQSDFSFKRVCNFQTTEEIQVEGFKLTVEPLEEKVSLKT